MIEFDVCGTEMALLVASTHALCGWPFFNPDARALAMEYYGPLAEAANDAVSAQARAGWRAAGLWDSDGKLWTRELIQRRAATPTRLRLAEEHIAVCIVALRAAHKEFAHSWGEFCVATPGNIDWYDAEPQSLVDLAKKLELRASGKENAEE